MRTISEFIQEQETGVIPEDNESYISAYCECAAALSLANCYAEQAALGVFALSNGEVPSFVQESDENKPGIFTKLGAGVKKAWEAFIRFWKTIIGKVKEFFVGKKVKIVNDKLSMMDPTEMITIDRRALYPYAFVMFAHGVVKTIRDGMLDQGEDQTSRQWLAQVAAYNKNVEELISKGSSIRTILERLGKGDTNSGTNKYGGSSSLFTLPNFTMKDDKITLTVGEFKEIIKFYQSDRVKGQLDQIKDAIGQVETKIQKKEASHRESKEAYDKYSSLNNKAKKKVDENREKWNKEHPDDIHEKPTDTWADENKLKSEATDDAMVIKKLNDVLNNTTKLYEQMISVFNEISSTVLKNPESVKAKSEPKTESAYLV